MRKEENRMKVLITGCTGFIGYHLAEYFLEKGKEVIGIDNLSRKGGEENLKSLLLLQGKFEFHKIDICNFEKITEVFKKCGPFDLILHLAGQVAVTISVTDPRDDFEINALGTFNLLEATRLYSPNAFFEFASTNKVYGKTDDINIIERNGKYEYDTLLNGVSEEHNLDFHSPYGCSKGAADQYVRDYNRIYGLKTVVLRQSCIYGTRQFGIEDQGWVAWFIIASLLNKPITIYGDGKQSRDILWIDDLVEIWVKLFENADRVSGEIFNIGGGTVNTLSLLELLNILRAEGILQREPLFANWRPGDQKVFVCNLDKVNKFVGWKPTIAPKLGVKKLIDWVVNNKTLLKKTLAIG